MVASLVLLVVIQKIDLHAVAERNAAAFRFAIVHRDAGWFERTFTKDFVQRTEEAKLDRRVALAQIQSGLLRMKATKLVEKVVAVKPVGREYVATVDWKGSMPATLRDRPAALDVSWRDEQRWTFVDGRWLLRSLTTSRFVRTIE